MKIIFPVFVFSVLINFQLLYSQIEDISTDRPDQCESPLLLPKGFIQVELGASIEKVVEFNSPIGLYKIFSHSYPSVLLRYGVSGNVEIRFGAEYLQEELSNIEDSSPNERGFSPLSVGTKIKMFTEKGLLPEAALLLSLSIPFKDKGAFQSEYIGTEFRFAISHTLSKRFSLSYNIGGEFGAGSTGATGLYTVSLGAGLINKLSAFVEIYGFLPEKSSPDHRFDAGLTFLIMKNIQADASFGLGISGKSPDYFVGLGVSVRLPK